MLSSYTSRVTAETTAPTAERPSTATRPSTASRASGAILGIVVGAIYGTVGTVAHQNTAPIGDVGLPVGLVLALIGVLGLLLGFRLLFDNRVPVLFAAIGLVGMIALFSVASAGGSVLIPQGLIGLVWTVVPVLVATIVVAWPRMPSRTTAPAANTPPERANVRHEPEA